MQEIYISIYFFEHTITLWGRESWSDGNEEIMSEGEMNVSDNFFPWLI